MKRKWIHDLKDLQKIFGKKKGLKYYKEGRWFFIKESKNKTKSRALKFAKSYMRKH